MTTTITTRPPTPQTTTEARMQFCRRECGRYQTEEAIQRFAPLCQLECWLEEPYGEDGNDNRN